MGDISDGIKDAMTDDWIETISTHDPTRLANYLNYRSKSTSLDSDAVADNHNTALGLCLKWDNDRGDKRKFSTLGFMIARAYLNETRLLPNIDADWTDALDEMREKTEEQVRAFGLAAWYGMQASHGFVYDQHVKIFELARPRFMLDIEQNRDYFLAGMMLPYMLSVASRLKGYYENENILGVKVGTVEELEATDFLQIFVREK